MESFVWNVYVSSYFEWVLMCCDGRRTLNIQNEFMAKDALLSLSWPTTSWTGDAPLWESGWRFVVLGCPCLTDLLWRFGLSFSEPCDDCCPWLFFWRDVTLCVLDIAWWGFECWLLEFADFGCWCCYLKKADYAAFVHAIQRMKIECTVVWDILGRIMSWLLKLRIMWELRHY